LTRKRIEALAEVSTLPFLSRKGISALSNDAAAMYDFEDLISHDQALASKVVSIANSAFYYTHRGVEVNSIGQAMLVLGLDAVRNIVLGISIFRIFPVPYGTLKQMWAHAYRVALASGFLASRIDESDREVVFLAGLLHDIGRIVILTVGSEGELSRFPDSGGKEIIRAEKEAFSCSHDEAGYWFLTPYQSSTGMPVGE
jgi:HD-like signal output (HDOD) protein